jgi:RHS repeat-associated protein
MRTGASTLIDYQVNAGGIARVRVADAAGTLLRDTTVTRSDAFVTGLTSAVADEDSVSFAYDSLRRLTAANYGQGGTAADAHSWSFDDTFAVTAASDSGALAYTAGTHQLASVGGEATTYDAAGRIVAARYGTLAFDAADRLTGVTLPSGDQIAHTYDHRGRRSRSVAAGASTYLSPVDNIEIQDGTAAVWIAFGNRMIAADIGGTLSFVQMNALGAMDLITDAAGKLAGRVRQTPFGVARPAGGGEPTGSAAVIALLLVGADATGLICQGRRWYDPQVGQFISPDPIVSGTFIIGAWNPYIFCLGNPIALADPNGSSILSVLEMIGIAVLAAASVVLTVFTCGIGLFGVDAMTTLAAEDLMIGVAVGSFGGAIAGEMAAQKAGGNIWAGGFVGAYLSGVATLVGGVLGMAVHALDTLPPYNSVISYVVAGFFEGTCAGAGTGVAIGFAGGKGTSESTLLAMAQGVAWGAALGTLLGVGVGMIVGGKGPRLVDQLVRLQVQVPGERVDNAGIELGRQYRGHPAIGVADGHGRPDPGQPVRFLLQHHHDGADDVQLPQHSAVRGLASRLQGRRDRRRSRHLDGDRPTGIQLCPAGLSPPGRGAALHRFRRAAIPDLGSERRQQSGGRYQRVLRVRKSKFDVI